MRRISCTNDHRARATVPRDLHRQRERLHPRADSRGKVRARCALERVPNHASVPSATAQAYGSRKSTRPIPPRLVTFAVAATRPRDSPGCRYGAGVFPLLRRARSRHQRRPQHSQTWLGLARRILRCCVPPIGVMQQSAVNKASVEAAAKRSRLAGGIPFLSSSAGATGKGGKDVKIEQLRTKAMGHMCPISWPTGQQKALFAAIACCCCYGSRPEIRYLLRIDAQRHACTAIRRGGRNL